MLESQKENMMCGDAVDWMGSRKRWAIVRLQIKAPGRIYLFRRRFSGGKWLLALLCCKR